MTYAALLEAYGYERFVTDASAAGAASLIVADLPAGDHPDLRRIQLVASTSTDERIALAPSVTDGWLYLVTVTGTTGVRRELSPGPRAPRRAGASDRRRSALRGLRHRDSGAGACCLSARGRRRRRLAGARNRRVGTGRAIRVRALAPACHRCRCLQRRIIPRMIAGRWVSAAPAPESRWPPVGQEETRFGRAPMPRFSVWSAWRRSLASGARASASTPPRSRRGSLCGRGFPPKSF